MNSKKLFLGLALTLASAGASAQFERGTRYANTSLSGFNMSYGGENKKFQLGLDAAGGYFVEDNWMVLGRFGWQHQYQKYLDNVNNVTLNVGARYYSSRYGVFAGAGLQYERAYRGALGHDNYVQLVPEVGYCYYINHYVSIEPSVYCHLGLNDFKGGSQVGLRLGVGFYF